MQDDLVFNQTTKLTNPLAAAIANGFGEGEYATVHDQLRAWAYLIKTGTARMLQGLYGKMSEDLVEMKFITSDGKILWDNIPIQEERKVKQCISHTHS